jgi:hypothetical protein
MFLPLLLLLQVLSSSTHEVERRSLMSQLPDAWAVLRNLGTVITLQEPTYPQVVVLYRNAVKHRATGSYDDDDDSVSEDEDTRVTWKVGVHGTSCKVEVSPKQHTVLCMSSH